MKRVLHSLTDIGMIITILVYALLTLPHLIRGAWLDTILLERQRKRPDIDCRGLGK